MNLRKLVFMMSVGFIALMLGIGGIVTAGEIYESAFGFRAVFPDKWMVLDKSYAIENPQAVESAFLTAQKDRELTPETKATLVSVKEMILRGEIEYYFSENPHFVVAVNKSPGTVPETDEELQNLCRAFPSELSARAGKSINVYECSRKSFNGRSALLLIADGQNPGSKYIQYQLKIDPRNVIIFTATGADSSSFDKMASLMESFMKSVEIKN